MEKKYKIIRSPEPVNQKHDKGYKRIFAKKQNFLHFLKKYIKADWVDSIDEIDLTLINATFIDADFKQKESDVIYKLKLKDREIIFYILQENQSSVDYTMPFRLLVYMTALLKREFRNTAKHIREASIYRLPAIVPIVMYNGFDNWTAVRSFKEYLHEYAQYGDYIIDFKYLLFDLNRENEETILSTNQLLDIVFALDKKPNRDNMGKMVQIAMEHYSRMNDDDKDDMIDWLRHIWLSHIKDENEKDRILSIFERGDVTNMMRSGLYFMIQDEVQEESKKVRLAMIKNLIKMGLSNRQISEATDFTMSESEVEELKEQQQEPEEM
jgi:predicted transposase/invertase (TIGR01784 family)